MGKVYEFKPGADNAPVTEIRRTEPDPDVEGAVVLGIVDEDFLSERDAIKNAADSIDPDSAQSANDDTAALLSRLAIRSRHTDDLPS